jgi:hypothetical protein
MFKFEYLKTSIQLFLCRNYKNSYVHTGRKKERERERQTDRETDRQTDRQRDRQTERERKRKKERERKKEKQRKRERERKKETKRMIERKVVPCMWEGNILTQIHSLFSFNGTVAEIWR